MSSGTSSHLTKISVGLVGCPCTFCGAALGSDKIRITLKERKGIRKEEEEEEEDGEKEDDDEEECVSQIIVL